MYNRPNRARKIRASEINSQYSLGDNNLNARFKKVLFQIMTSEYFEGSNYGKYYNEFREDGRSKIYVDQPELEQRLQKQFLDEDKDSFKFLVGPTGVGKTTLIRNMFHVFDRDIVAMDNNLIIYISFYSMVSYHDMRGDVEAAVRSTVLGGIKNAISFLDGKDYIERLSERTDEYYEGLYDFIKVNYGHLFRTYPERTEYCEKLKSENGKAYVLDWLLEEMPVDYNMCVLKYYLHVYKEKKHKMFDNVILILDDMEAQDVQYGEKIVDFAYYCKKCMQAKRERGYNFKVLISMRNYSYRIQKLRKSEAFRDTTWEDVILKNSVPRLGSVIEKRVKCILERKGATDSIDDKEAFAAARESLEILLKRMYLQYDEMLLSLTHFNVFKSMQLILRILTNKAFIGKYEIDRAERGGSFSFSEKDYHIENSSGNPAVPGNDDVYYALAYGERDFYYDSGDYYLSNIMHFRANERVDTELFGIYIIQYFIRQDIVMDSPAYDGYDTLPCLAVVDEIMCLYDFPAQQYEDGMREGLNEMMAHLYRGGILLQSILEPVCEDIESKEREYNPEMKVYLSMRGKQLYDMLSYNSLLLATYRDDIDTEIDGNDVLTLKMSMEERVLYCLAYIEHLADKEITYLRWISPSRYKKYMDTLGVSLAVVILMKGIKETLDVYFSNDTPQKQVIVEKYDDIRKKVNLFLNSIQEDAGAEFERIT